MTQRRRTAFFVCPTLAPNKTIIPQEATGCDPVFAKAGTFVFLEKGGTSVWCPPAEVVALGTETKQKRLHVKGILHYVLIRIVFHR